MAIVVAMVTRRQHKRTHINVDILQTNNAVKSATTHHNYKEKGRKELDKTYVAHRLLECNLIVDVLVNIRIFNTILLSVVETGVQLFLSVKQSRI